MFLGYKFAFGLCSLVVFGLTPGVAFAAGADEPPAATIPAKKEAPVVGHPNTFFLG